MADNWTSKYSWILTGIAAPLLVLVFAPIVTPLTTKLMHTGKELSYSISDPILDLNQDITAGLPITVGGQAIKSLAAYRVTLRNSGGTALHDLAVRIRFVPQDASQFEIVSVSHHTTPQDEFGQIIEEKDQSSRRFTYSLLNPSDSDQLIFLVSTKADIAVFAKSEDLRVLDEKPDKNSGQYLLRVVETIALIIAALQLIFIEITRRRRDAVVKKLKPQSADTK